jgi:hypothetical protein
VGNGGQVRGLAWVARFIRCLLGRRLIFWFSGSDFGRNRGWRTGGVGKGSVIGDKGGRKNCLGEGQSTFGAGPPEKESLFNPGNPQREFWSRFRGVLNQPPGQNGKSPWGGPHPHFMPWTIPLGLVGIRVGSRSGRNRVRRLPLVRATLAAKTADSVFISFKSNT